MTPSLSVQASLRRIRRCALRRRANSKNYRKKGMKRILRAASIIRDQSRYGRPERNAPQRCVLGSLDIVGDVFTRAKQGIGRDTGRISSRAATRVGWGERPPSNRPRKKDRLLCHRFTDQHYTPNGTLAMDSLPPCEARRRAFLLPKGA
jgi:hypothetical protein